MDLSPGGKHLRVWQLGFRTDFGLAGMVDPFDMVGLIELVLAHGLLGFGLFQFINLAKPALRSFRF